ncbi:uncharacterized protein LOC113346241 [Papaver somniferum]|uniref:uncharacterized protein LOC113346241 n=1 Tax=Papaver somniferum TaxID=3469 RepID=UPI000E6FCDFB|nr:uncharacterized protein LOC113346241 [Papaver somniferum]
MATRMGHLMHKLVSPQQVAYVKGRCIQDQIRLASEMINEMAKKGRCGNVGLKLDISQAYDSVSWEFFLKHGLRQGDPLSPILFVLMEEALSRRLTQMVKAGLIFPMVVRKGIHPTHLLFADDVFIFCNGAKKSILNLIKLLEDYQKSSGQIINKQKSKMFIDGASELRKNQLKEMIQMERSVFPDKYLGVILCVGRAKYKDKNGQWSSKWQLSSVWPGLKWARETLKEDIRWRIGDDDGVWSLPTEFQQIISNGQLPEICGGEDVLIWTRNLKGKFSVPEALNKIRHKEQKVNWSKYIWNSFFHPSTASNVWKIIQGVYKDDTTMISNGYEIVSRCCICESEQDSMMHLLCECSFGIEIWRWICVTFNFVMPKSIDDIWRCASNCSSLIKQVWITVDCSILKELWFQKNKKFFDNIKPNARAFKCRILKLVNEGDANGVHLKLVLLCSAVMGSSFGNPGAARFGIVVRNSDCQVVATVSGGIGIASNYLAETYGVINAMKLAVQWEMKYIIIVSDSKTVIAEFFQGNVPWFIKGRWLKAIKHFKQIRYMHCYREVNFSADNTAKRGTSLDAGERQLHMGRPQFLPRIEMPNVLLQVLLI